MTNFRVTDEDRYRFDLQGYLVLRGVLSSAELDEMNRIIDGLPETDGNASETSAFGMNMLMWGQPFLDLMDHPRILPYLTEWVDRSVRLDHAYPIFSQKGSPGTALHGGAHDFHSTFYYFSEAGKIRSSLTVVSWALVDNPPGQGFGCVPGSHKARFTRPDSCEDVAIAVPAQAGDVIIFTEALTHASLPWNAPHARRQLFYKYCPGTVAAWSLDPWPDELKSSATPAQRRMLEPPYLIDRVQGWRRAVDDMVMSPEKIGFAKQDTI